MLPTRFVLGVMTLERRKGYTKAQATRWQQSIKAWQSQQGPFISFASYSYSISSKVSVFFFF